jgi:hypothetical protein
MDIKEIFKTFNELDDFKKQLVIAYIQGLLVSGSMEV